MKLARRFSHLSNRILGQKRNPHCWQEATIRRRGHTVTA